MLMKAAETHETTPAASGSGRWFPREMQMLLVIWLVVAVAKTLAALPMLTDRTFPDPDDAMRLLQVRDWLAGQSWFDITQYRLNPPFGGPMHWSRYVDLPIAAVILMFRPFVGQYNAETAALIIVPMVTLFAAMLLVYRLTLRLATPRTALLAVIGAPASLGAMTQMRPMRIDHHGWQIVLALAVMLAALDSKPRRAGVMAGVAMALWLNISVEAMPFAVATAALFALQWLHDAEQTERLKTYLVTLALAPFALFAATRVPATWLVIHHDNVNCGHFAAFAAAGLAGLGAIRKERTNKIHRIGSLAFIGVAATAAIYGVDPHFLRPPFSELDPLVNRLWYSAVDEGQPIWHLAPKDMAVALAQQFVGLAGAALAIRKTEGEARRLWTAYGFLMLAATLISIAVTREATLASLLSLAGTAFLCDFALVRARQVPHVSRRILATTGALLIMAPAYAVPAATMPKDPNNGQPDFGAKCGVESEIRHLNALPKSILAIPLDITPAILAATPHIAIGSGHHRNVSGIKDMILFYVGSVRDQRDVIARRHIQYVVFCPGTAEAGWWAGNGPAGLAASLNKGRTPAWLEPVPIKGMRYLRVWRVKGPPRA